MLKRQSEDAVLSIEPYKYRREIDKQHASLTLSKLLTSINTITGKQKNEVKYCSKHRPSPDQNRYHRNRPDYQLNTRRHQDYATSRPSRTDSPIITDRSFSGLTPKFWLIMTGGGCIYIDKTYYKNCIIIFKKVHHKLSLVIKIYIYIYEFSNNP